MPAKKTKKPTKTKKHNVSVKGKKNITNQSNINIKIGTTKRASKPRQPQQKAPQGGGSNIVVHVAPPSLTQIAPPLFQNKPVDTPLGGAIPASVPLGAPIPPVKTEIYKKEDNPFIPPVETPDIKMIDKYDEPPIQSSSKFTYSSVNPLLAFLQPPTKTSKPSTAHPIRTFTDFFSPNLNPDINYIENYDETPNETPDDLPIGKSIGELEFIPYELPPAPPPTPEPILTFETPEEATTGGFGFFPFESTPEPTPAPTPRKKNIPSTFETPEEATTGGFSFENEPLQIDLEPLDIEPPEPIPAVAEQLISNEEEDEANKPKVDKPQIIRKNTYDTEHMNYLNESKGLDEFYEHFGNAHPSVLKKSHLLNIKNRTMLNDMFAYSTRDNPEDYTVNFKSKHVLDAIKNGEYD